jgi:phosphate transport system substrate-binding protein
MNIPALFSHGRTKFLALSLLGPILAFSVSGRTLPTAQTAAEAAYGKEHGRTPPTPELLQPTLDPALPHYVPRTDVALAGHFKGAASDVLAVLTKHWIEAFQKYYPNVSIDVPPPYAGSLGALELIAGNLDFVMVSRELKPSDIIGFNKKFGYDPFSTPISGGTYRHYGFLDAVAFCVNKDNPINHLTFVQLDGILSKTHVRGGGAITTWGQLGLTGDWADKPIHVWAIKPWNGFEEFVRERVLSTSSARGEWRDDLNYVETVFPVNGKVAADRYALGYAGLAYMDEQVKLIALAPKDDGVYVAPGYEEVARADYPLSRVTYINLNKPPGNPLNPALEEFTRFILSREGQQVVLDQAIFLPLRANQADDSRRLLEK